MSGQICWRLRESCCFNGLFLFLYLFYFILLLFFCLFVFCFVFRNFCQEQVALFSGHHSENRSLDHDCRVTLHHLHIITNHLFLRICMVNKQGLYRNPTAGGNGWLHRTLFQSRLFACTSTTLPCLGLLHHCDCQLSKRLPPPLKKN